MQSFVKSFLQLEFSANVSNLPTVLPYAAACAICIGWLALLSFSIASVLTSSL